MAAVCLDRHRERDRQGCRLFRPAATCRSNINHPCCILFARDDLLAQNPDLVTAVSALTQASSKYINEHPAEAADIEADFLVGKGNFTYGNVTVSSVDVLNDAFPTVKYTNEPSAEWITGTKKFVATEIELGYITGKLKNATTTQLNANFLHSDLTRMQNNSLHRDPLRHPQGNESDYYRVSEWRHAFSRTPHRIKEMAVLQ